MEKYVRESRKIGFDLVALLLLSSSSLLSSTTTTPFRCHIQKQRQKMLGVHIYISKALNKQVYV